MAIKLYPHQKEAVMNLQNGNILWGGVGTGKTLTSLAYYMAKEKPKDVYVITTAKKRDSLDWEHDASEFGIGKAKDATVAGVLYVDSWNNIAKYTEVENAFFIFDEQRLVGAGAWTESFIKISKHNRWILLSATPGDTWLDYIPVFVANGFYKNRTEFKREHVVYNNYSKFPKVDRYVNTGQLARLRNEILVEMPYLSHTARKTTDVTVEFDKEMFDEALIARWNPFTSEPLKDVSELFRVMRKIVNTDPSRINAVKYLMKKHPRLIIFYNFDYELEMLRELGKETILKENKSWTKKKSANTALSRESFETTNASVVEPKLQTKNGKIKTTGMTASTTSGSLFQMAEYNGHKHEDCPEGDKWIYLVQYVAGSEAWNSIATDAMCFFSLTYSYKNFHQAHGRIDRLNTPYTELYYYILKSKSAIDLAIFRSLSNKKNFNESEYKNKFGK